jgi:sulfur-carrier protein
MPVVHIPGLLLSLTGGDQKAELTGSTVAELIGELDLRYPGIKNRLVDGDRLRAGLCVFVDGSMRREGLHCEVSPQSDVHFIPAIAGGRYPQTEAREPG